MGVVGRKDGLFHTDRQRHFDGHVGLDHASQAVLTIEQAS